MSQDRIRIIASIERADKDLLDQLAHEGTYCRSRLVGDILRQFLDDSHNRRALRAALRARLYVDIASLPAAIKLRADQRRKIVKQWETLVSFAKRRHESCEAATARFLLKLKQDTGLRLSRATLYNWRRLLFTKGYIGVVDRRFRRSIPKLKKG